MHQELRLHGHIDDTIEYFATVAAHNVERCHFYDRDAEGLRIFSPGNEIRLDSTGLMHWGNGGSFCEYMHGINRPLADLLKKDVCNRLILFGAHYRENGELFFSNETGGRVPFDTIFEDGHAVCNFFFFLTGSVYGALKTQQEDILCLLGKLLKRSQQVAVADDARLVDELYGLLGHKSHFYLIRLINKKHQAYEDLFRTLYYRFRAIPDEEFEHLKTLARRLDIPDHQQRRIRVAVMHSHRDNKQVVDEYRDILVDCHVRGRITPEENARLTRLKTLAMRNKIPAELFEPLDERLRYEKMVDQELDYIAESREILSGLLQQNHNLPGQLTREDIVSLLHHKRRAMNSRDFHFDQIMLETSKACDEKVHATGDISLGDKLTSILNYFEQYETCLTEINNLAFMVGVRITEPMLRDIQRGYRLLERLQPGLFRRLLFDDLLGNRFLGNYGRRKVSVLQLGLKHGDGVSALREMLHKVSREEFLYNLMLRLAKEEIRNRYSPRLSWENVVLIQQAVEDAMRQQRALDGPFPLALFRDVMHNLAKEVFYLEDLLPQVVAEKNYLLREDFLLNSGLDRFYIEELENEYIEHQRLNPEVIRSLRRLGDPPSDGEGP